MLVYIQLTVDIARVQQLIVGTLGNDLAAVKNDNLVGILNRSDSLSNNDFCGFGNE